MTGTQPTEVNSTAKPTIESPEIKLPFLPEEWAQLKAQDKQAATAVVFIMGIIFSMGFIGYLIICLIAMKG